MKNFKTKMPVMILRATLLAVVPVMSLFSGPPEGVSMDTTDWIPYPTGSFNSAGGTALDMSGLLDAPAGRRGFVQVDGDQFVFEDGTPVRFWGGNLFGEANFPDKDSAVRMADAIARSGANIIRLHHIDAVLPWTDKVVQRNIFGGQRPETTRKLDPKNLDRMHYFIHLLKERGVYIFLSHISSRYVMEGDHHPGGQEALDDVGQGFKGDAYFDPFLIELQKEFLSQLLLAKNPYTDLPLAADPVLALIEINNENSLFFIRPEKPDDRFAIKSRYYRDLIQGQFAEWLKEKYGDQDALEKAWAEKDKATLFPSEDLDQGRIIVPHMNVTDQNWPVSKQRKLDTFAFLYDVQETYYGDMYEFFRDLGLKCPITGSNHWSDYPADLRVNADYDYMDRHAYWTHPLNRVYNYSEGQGIQAKPMVKEPLGGNFESLSTRHVHGLPYAVSEWHHPLPNPYRAEGLPLMAAYCSLHNWHPMQFGYYGEQTEDVEMINSFEIFFDPAHMNLMPIAALMFHRQDFKEADRGYYDLIHPEQTLDPEFKARYHPEVALMGKYGIAFSDVSLPESNDTALLEAAMKADGVYNSVTDEMTWDSKRGIVTLDSSRSQGVVGFIGGQVLETRNMTFEVDTAYAVVVAASLDNEPLESSNRILVSTSGDARFTDIGISPDFTLIEKTGRFPFLMEPVVGQVSIRTSRKLDVFALDSSGQRMKQLEGKLSNGMLHFSLYDRAMQYELIARR